MKSIQFDPFEDVLEDVRSGRAIVMVDDDDRENEGDLMVAAEKATAENINFMFREGKGLVCISLEKKLLKTLGMPVQAQFNTSPFGTNFAVSFDLKTVAGRGASASARAETIRAAVQGKALPEDFVRPGHVFPVGAVSGGVLNRRGQTEGSVDISRLAGLHPSGVICEIMDEKGEMLRGDGLQEYCKKHQLKITSVEEIVKYRIKHELAIRKVAELDAPQVSRNKDLIALLGSKEKQIESKLFVYEDDLSDIEHFALVIGNPSEEKEVVVRVHCEDLFNDVFDSLWVGNTPKSSGKLDRALKEIYSHGSGVLVYLRQEPGKAGLAAQVEALSDEVKTKHLESSRDYRSAAYILAELGLKDIRLIEANPHKIQALKDYGLNIIK